MDFVVSNTTAISAAVAVAVAVAVDVAVAGAVDVAADCYFLPILSAIVTHNWFYYHRCYLLHFCHCYLLHFKTLG